LITEQRQRTWLIWVLLLALALTARVLVARYLVNDGPGDGKIYAQMARNLLEQHVYSHDTEPPYNPSLIRLPGYPLFLATIYSVFGHYNNTAVRITHAVIDTLTCALVALVAYYWEPDDSRKRRSALAAFALAAICPFPAIYIATILTETWACFFAVSLCLLTTLAFKAASPRKGLLLWTAVGLLGGVGVFFRPDSGLFVLAVGLSLVLTSLSRKPLRPKKLSWLLIQGIVLSIAFMSVLVPWTIRNWRTFHVFQPLAPAHADMPGEFVPRGYLAWLRTWIDDGRYVETVLWPLDDKQISMDEMPESAFDSEEEEVRVTELMEQYNHPPHPPDDEAAPAASPNTDPTPSSSPTPSASPGQEKSEEKAPGDQEPAEETGEATEEPEEPEQPEMTAAIDAEFAKIAQERIARHPFRYYLWLPMKRAWSLWANPHADYYPFSGELFPLDDLDYTIHQHIWLPLFAILVLLYTLLGFAGAWRLWRAGTRDSRRWLLLVTLLIFIRLAFFSTIENPEPRYTVEFFPFLAILGGLAISRLGGRGPAELAADKRG